MNCVGFGFSVMIVIFAICPKSGSRTDFDLFPQPSEVSDNVASLLHSLVKVNEERVHALNKFLKLNDFKAGSQKSLRTGDEKKEDSERVLAFVLFNVQPDEPFDKIPFIAVHERDSDTDTSSESSSDSDERKDQKNKVMRTYYNIRDIKTEPDSSHEVVSTENSKPVNKTDLVLPDNSSENNQLKKSEASYTDYHNYLYCVSACKEAYRNACSYYECSRRLYHQLRKECRYSCHYQFDERRENK